MYIDKYFVYLQINQKNLVQKYKINILFKYYINVFICRIV